MITIKRATIEDITTIRQLLRHTWLDTYKPFLSEKVINKITTVWHSENAIKSQLEDADNYFALAKTQTDEAIGIITIRKIDPSSIFLHRLYIHPKYQRQGIGKQLLDASLEILHTIKKIVLEVDAFNLRAISFYQKHEFREVERKKEKIEDMELDVIVMEKQLIKI